MPVQDKKRQEKKYFFRFFFERFAFRMVTPQFFFWKLLLGRTGFEPLSSFGGD